MTITTLHVVPLVIVFDTKSVHTIFFFEIIWLILGPGCKVSMSTIHPSKVTLCWSVIQTQPGLLSIMAMLYVNIFFVIVDVNKDWVFLSTFFYCCGPICTGITREITEAIEVAPLGIADV